MILYTYIHVANDWRKTVIVFWGKRKKNRGQTFSSLNLLSLVISCYTYILQFLCEMSAAWQNTVDRKLGIFAEDKHKPDPLAKAEGEVLSTNPPFAKPHHIWTQVTTGL